MCVNVEVESAGLWKSKGTTAISLFTTENDSRIRRFGAFFTMTSLDELLRLFNATSWSLMQDVQIVFHTTKAIPAKGGSR